VTCGEINKLSGADGEERVSKNNKSADFPLDQILEGLIEFACSASANDLKLQAQRARCVLRSRRFPLRLRIIWVRQDTDHRGLGHEFMEQAERLDAKLFDQKAHACDVAARPAETWHQTRFDWIGPGNENDGNRLGCHLGGKSWVISAKCSDHRCLARHEIGRKRRQPICSAIGPAVLNLDVLCLDIAVAL
jgi:hypothetical protein